MKPLLSIALLVAGLFVVAGCENDDPVATPEDPLPEFVTYSSDYLNHRFFQLDLPLIEPGGRDIGDHILLETIKIFKLIQAAQPSPGDLLNVATYVDSLGFLNWGGLDFENPYLFGRVWREINVWVPVRDADGQLVAVDLGPQMAFEDILAVIYEVRQADGAIVKVGDNPGLDVPQQTVIGGEGLYYRMKLLKAAVWDREPHTFGYVLRNIYSLGSGNIDPAGFALRIERNEPGINQPWRDENWVDYLRIFGLDRDNPLRTGFPDNQVDFWDPFLINLEKGLLTFPRDFPRPFAPGGNPTGRYEEADMMAAAVYSAYADTAAFVWDPSFLRDNQTWQIYDPEVYPWDYPQYEAFKIITTYDPHVGECP
jgi:hypothetical protein